MPPRLRLSVCESVIRRVVFPLFDLSFLSLFR